VPAVKPRVRVPVRLGFRWEERAVSLEVRLEALEQTQARAAFAETGWREVAGQAERRGTENPARAQELTAKIGRRTAVAWRAGCRTRTLELAAKIGWQRIAGL
jgi:hypothetical protein